MNNRQPMHDINSNMGQFQAAILHLEALCVALSWKRNLRSALFCAENLAQSLTVVALICFLNGPATVEALDHRSRHNMQNWIASGRLHGELHPATKLADIGTLLRRARHRSKGLSISSPIAARLRRFHYRMRTTAHWPILPQPDPEEIFSEIDAVLQLVEAAMLAGRVNWPNHDLRKRCQRLVKQAELRLDRIRLLVSSQAQRKG